VALLPLSLRIKEIEGPTTCRTGSLHRGHWSRRIRRSWPAIAVPQVLPMESASLVSSTGRP